MPSCRSPSGWEGTPESLDPNYHSMSLSTTLIPHVLSSWTTATNLPPSNKKQNHPRNFLHYWQENFPLNFVRFLCCWSIRLLLILKTIGRAGMGGEWVECLEGRTKIFWRFDFLKNFSFEASLRQSSKEPSVCSFVVEGRMIGLGWESGLQDKSHISLNKLHSLQSKNSRVIVSCFFKFYLQILRTIIMITIMNTNDNKIKLQIF